MPWAQNWYLYFLIDSSFHRVNSLFVLSFGNVDLGETYKWCHLPIVEIKDYNVMIDGRIFFDQLIENNSRSYDNIWKSVIGQGDDCTTGCLLDYLHFKKYKLIATDVSK